MRILILSKNGNGCGMAYKLTMEGHHVDLWIKDPQYKHDLEGIVNRPTEWRPLLTKADLIICDMVGFSQYAELFQKLGKPYLCCNPVADVMELDRLKGLETFKKAGINQPDYWYYKTPEACLAELDKIYEEPGIVLKPFGNIDTGKTYVCEDIELARWALSTYPAGTELIAQCMISPEDTVEVSTEGWYNGREFIQPFNHTFEEKKFMCDSVGKMCGCMGNVVITTKEDKLVAETLLKLEPVLKKAGYKGPLDVNCLVSKDKLYALEMTCRFGYDAIDALMQGLREPLANLLFETALGSKKDMDISSDFLLAVRVTRDPYPNQVQSLPKRDQDYGMPILGLTGKDMDHVYLYDVYLDEKGVLRYAAADGVLLKATSFGKTIEQARDRAYRVVHNIKTMDIQYRPDIGVRAIKDIETLKSWGWLN